MFDDNYGLTEAVLQGRKTMTRRWADVRWSAGDINDKPVPKYKVGEVLAVAQSYKDLGYTKEWVEQHISPNPNANWNDPFEKKYPGWSNKMYVKAKWMQHHIRITDIKEERLQNISDEDCMCEGVMWDYDDYPIMSRKVYLINDYESFCSPRLAFASLINRIYGKSTWESNPWEFAYSFELVK